MDAPTSTLDDLADLVRRTGKGLFEINLKLRRLLDREPESAPPREEPAGSFDLLADVVEGLDRAIAECRRPPVQGAESVAIGLELVRRRILEALGAAGYFTVKARGEFDSRSHRVVSTVEDAPGGRIVSVVRRGWARRVGDRVTLVKPALVVVGAKRNE